ncbi:hypothetical protein SAMN02927900_02171 [Rhizobium mongolense subsp. loessense]|uniref:Uncharacterized protein n=1 Tax=Rhizobium mongolense subsp. loessense TaxID=158890 RepID=A0A1G4R142_9HYPH|nr:hypothetical protein [Rhizobium mongolense]SCW50584.1 hypothetical protein SAMN02927900_02171 [Rhizobium mongolense subsp. loessense]
MQPANRTRPRIFSTVTTYSQAWQQPGFGLALRKMILMKRAVASAFTRAPGPTLSATDIAELNRLMARTEEKLKDF